MVKGAVSSSTSLEGPALGHLPRLKRGIPRAAIALLLVSVLPGCGRGGGGNGFLSSPVLVSGGQGLESLATAEIYDPARRMFEPPLRMNEARASHTATPIAGGILIAGGFDVRIVGNTFRQTSLATAERYDFATGTFVKLANLNAPRGSHTATLLQDGRVLIAGGDDNGKSLASAELFDPATSSLATTGSMTDAREDHTANLLPDGRVLIAGGIDCSTIGNCTYLKSAEAYDPAAGTFSPVASMNVFREGQTATDLAGGQVLIAGGFDGQNNVVVASAEIFEPETNTFVPTGDMTDSRLGHAAAALPDGSALIAGGGDNSGNFLKTAEVYQPGTRSFHAVGSMSIDRTAFAATPLGNGPVLVAGGFTQCPSEALSVCLTPVDTAELYDPATETFSLTGRMSAKRAALAAAPL